MEPIPQHHDPITVTDDTVPSYNELHRIDAGLPIDQYYDERRTVERNEGNGVLDLSDGILRVPDRPRLGSRRYFLHHYYRLNCDPAMDFEKKSSLRRVGLADV